MTHLVSQHAAPQCDVLPQLRPPRRPHRPRLLPPALHLVPGVCLRLWVWWQGGHAVPARPWPAMVSGAGSQPLPHLLVALLPCPPPLLQHELRLLLLIAAQLALELLKAPAGSASRRC